MFADKKSPDPRRREAVRSSPALAAAIVRLAALEPGGSFERPIEVRSASQVDIHAESLACPLCGGACRLVVEHEVERRGDSWRRVATIACVHCGAPRTVWFRLGSPLPS